jgi:hypothetical protein
MEHIPDPDQELRDTRRHLKCVEQERDEYADRMHALVEQCARMTSAASMAAATAEAALRRILRMEPVVKAAIAFNADSNRINLKFALDEQVEVYLESEPS